MRGFKYLSGGPCTSTARSIARAVTSAPGRATIVPVSLQHLLPSPGHLPTTMLAWSSQSGQSLALTSWQFSPATSARDWTDANADATGAIDTASTITTVRRSRLRDMLGFPRRILCLLAASRSRHNAVSLPNTCDPPSTSNCSKQAVDHLLPCAPRARCPRQCARAGAWTALQAIVIAAAAPARVRADRRRAYWHCPTPFAIYGPYVRGAAASLYCPSFGRRAGGRTGKPGRVGGRPGRRDEHGCRRRADVPEFRGVQQQRRRLHVVRRLLRSLRQYDRDPRDQCRPGSALGPLCAVRDRARAVRLAGPARPSSSQTRDRELRRAVPGRRCQKASAHPERIARLPVWARKMHLPSRILHRTATYVGT